MNASVTPSRSAEFDLSDFTQHDRQWKRPGFYLLLVVTLGLSLELAILLLPLVEFFLGPSPDIGAHATAILDRAVLGGVLLVFIAFAGASIPRFLPGARNIQVDNDGITLVFPSGRTERLSWLDHRDYFYIRDNSAYPRLVARGSTYYLYLPTLTHFGRDRRSLLSRAAFDAIVAKARDAGAYRRTWRGSALWNSYPPQIHWIQGKRSAT